MKKIIALLLTAALLCTGLLLPASAAEGLTYRLSSDGETQVYAKTGDIITVSFTVLKEGNEDYSINALQNEIKYNESFFQLVEGSIQANKGLAELQHKLAGDRVYMNTMLDTFSPSQLMGTFQLKVIGTQGSGMVESTEAKAYASDGSAFAITEENLTVIIGGKEDCTVTFESNGGSTVEPQQVPYGQTATEPKAPTRKGYTFAGWYSDKDCEAPWDFSTPVRQNLTLYADWKANTYTVRFDANGGTGTMKSQQFTYDVKQALRGCDFQNGECIFLGWALSRSGKVVYEDREYVLNLTDKQDGTVTLYAVWQGSGWTPSIDDDPALPEEPSDPALPCDGGALCPSRQYQDIIPSQWHHSAVDYVVENQLMNGISDTLFSPDTNMTRAMLVTVLYRMEGTPACGSTTAFNDVVVDSWYGKAVIWATENGIVKGTSTTTFSPNDPVTREQIATILYRFTSYKGYPMTALQSVSSFADAGTISSFAKEAMQWAYAAGLIQGRSGNLLAPISNASRAEVATILMRYENNVAK